MEQKEKEKKEEGAELASNSDGGTRWGLVLSETSVSISM
jgi:hypothetical protein